MPLIAMVHTSPPPPHNFNMTEIGTHLRIDAKHTMQPFKKNITMFDMEVVKTAE